MFFFHCERRNKKNSTHSATTPACCVYRLLENNEWLRLTVDVRTSHHTDTLRPCMMTYYWNVGVISPSDGSAIHRMVKIKWNYVVVLCLLNRTNCGVWIVKELLFDVSGMLLCSRDAHHHKNGFIQSDSSNCIISISSHSKYCLQPTTFCEYFSKLKWISNYDQWITAKWLNAFHLQTKCSF